MLMPTTRRLIILTLILLCLPLFSTDAWGASRPVTAVADWNMAHCAGDQGEVDDFTSPSRTDITAFCLAADQQSLKLLMAIDDTGLNKGNSAVVGVRFDLDGDGEFDVVVMADFGGSPAALKDYAIGRCDAAGSCGNSGDICQGNLCGQAAGTPVATGSGSTWPSPFARPSADCSGPGCADYDTFVEFSIPWPVFPSPEADGQLSAPPSPFIFGNYSSFPSGAGNGDKDVQDVQGNGIACTAGGCYAASPTAVTLSGMAGRPEGSGAGWFLLAAALLSAATGSILRGRRVA